ncbi:hypothetical protein NBRC116602_00060 [Hyphomicrobiales bacterium 4NK60-0047b]
MILFTDTVMSEIDLSISQKEPEQGGALLGAPDSNLISHFIYDEDAEVSHATYLPSKRLIKAVQELEKQDGLQFKGIIHSHPGMMDHPSGQDHHAFASQLTHNLHMGRFIAPIVTRHPHHKKKLKSHELALGDGAKLSCYQARFSFDKTINDNQLSVTSCEVGLVRYSAAIKHLMDMLENEFDPVIEADSDVLMINGLLHITRMIKTPLFELQIFFPQNFPTVAPLILFSEYQGKKLGLAQSINLTWSIVDVHPAKLGERLLPLIVKKIKETENATTRSKSTTGNSIYKSTKQRGNTSRTKETGLC